MVGLSERIVQRLVRFAGNILFRDKVRLIELFSALNLLAWAKVLHETPLLFARDSYRTFDSVGQPAWLFIFFVVAVVQLAGVLMYWRHVHEVRFLGFALASGAWSAVAMSFIISGVSTTAELNYSLLAIACMISGAFVGWKKRS